MTDATAASGRCLCGAVRFEYQGEPLEVLYCHCDSCRRQTSSPVAAFVMVRASSLRFTHGTEQVYTSSPGVRRSFCGNCGSPIAYRTERRPDIVDLYAGTLGNVSTLAPSSHVYAEEQLPWFETVDDLPRYAKGQRGTEPMRHGPRKSPR